MKKLHTYAIGFGLSAVLTLLAFGLVQKHLASGHVYPAHEVMVPLLVGLALVQLLVQLAFFIHLGEESKPRWNVGMFSLALIIVAILVGGTLWIMNDLGHSQGAPREIFINGDISPSTQND